MNNLTKEQQTQKEVAVSHDKLAYRIANIVARLSMGDRLTIKELSEAYQTSERTIRRDLERLGDVLPILKDKQCYFLTKAQTGQFNFADVSTLADLSGSKAIYPQWNLPFVNQLLSDHERIYQIKTDSPEDPAELKHNISLLECAISACHMLSFHYKQKQRTVAPYRLVHHGVWYLAGVEEGRLKTYRVSRISHLRDTRTLFSPDQAVIQQLIDEQGVWFVPEHEKITVHLHVDAMVADYFLQRALLPEQTLIKIHADKTLQLSCRVSHPMQLFPLVRFWIPHVRILSPDNWQSALNATLHAYLNCQTNTEDTSC